MPFIQRKIPLKYYQERKAHEEYYSGFNQGNHQDKYTSKAFRVCKERLDQEQCNDMRTY